MSVGRGLRFTVFQDDDFTCRYCGRRSPGVVLEVEHVIPRAKGGSDKRENLVTACYDCNHGKRDRSGVLPPPPAKDEIELPFPVGLRFICGDRQGIVESVTEDAARVRFLSWIDGLATGVVGELPRDTKWSGWTFYGRYDLMPDRLPL